MKRQGDMRGKDAAPGSLAPSDTNPVVLALERDSAPLRVDADGAVRISQSRVLLDTIVTAFRLGESAEEIADDFPTLDLAGVYAVIAYYSRHHPEIEAYLQQRGQQAEALRALLEKQHLPHELRNHLLARRDAANSSKWSVYRRMTT